LVGQNLLLKIGNKDYYYTIANIILEEGFFFNECQSFMKDFVLVGYANRLPSELVEQECYFFDEYRYFNKQKIKYIRNNYGDDYDYYFCDFYTDNKGYCADLTNSLNNKMSWEWYGALCVLISFFLMVIYIFFVFKNRRVKKRIYYIILCLLPMALYFINYIFVDFLFDKDIISFGQVGIFLIFIITIIVSALEYFTFRFERHPTNGY
jgi:hypothetical protein